jgi:hypothetical protein
MTRLQLIDAMIQNSGYLADLLAMSERRLLKVLNRAHWAEERGWKMYRKSNLVEINRKEAA